MFLSLFQSYLHGRFCAGNCLVFFFLSIYYVYFWIKSFHILEHQRVVFAVKSCLKSNLYCVKQGFVWLARWFLIAYIKPAEFWRVNFNLFYLFIFFFFFFFVFSVSERSSPVSSIFDSRRDSNQLSQSSREEFPFA